MKLKLKVMLELSKKILHHVSFDKALFYKELKKSIKWLKKAHEIQSLKKWCYDQFGSTHKEVLVRVFKDKMLK